MNNKNLWVVSAVLLLLGLGYARLNSFTEVTIEKFESNGWTLIGKSYEGKITDNGLRDTFDEIYQLKREGKIQGELVARFDGDLEGIEDVQVFVGIITEEVPTDSLLKLEVFTQPAYEAYSSVVELGGWSTPNPENVVKKIEETILKEEKTSQGIFIEHYLTERTVRHEVIIQ